jgi:hypothetical protein
VDIKAIISIALSLVLTAVIFYLILSNNSLRADVAALTAQRSTCVADNEQAKIAIDKLNGELEAIKQAQDKRAKQAAEDQKKADVAAKSYDTDAFKLAYTPAPGGDDCAAVKGLVDTFLGQRR